MTIVSVNKITLTGCGPEEYERWYREASAIMAAQPGHVSQRLWRSESRPDVYFAIAEWESAEHYRALMNVPEIVELFARLITLPGPPPPSRPDKIAVEHHDAALVAARVPV
ncbi:antibiotic biosynthesis monooxygenase family protein [Thermomonospora umbrina]|uniref:Heme-degrading monooxygenase HmoA n=1 Tax=Thermomonospora umbrina TaxID=111806 RepID=A0A3D9SX25_9ACTN|nr:antibiotic biosynthesis monooxygenase [Thermomonospora umbrina]REE99060.1 heme-degrading monooxygenase HmoA [Thermomonospora umbrina]